MIYKILFVVGLVWLFRILYQNITKLNELNDQRKTSKHDDALEAEYKVVDEEKDKS